MSRLIRAAFRSTPSHSATKRRIIPGVNKLCHLHIHLASQLPRRESEDQHMLPLKHASCTFNMLTGEHCSVRSTNIPCPTPHPQCSRIFHHPHPAMDTPCTFLFHFPSRMSSPLVCSLLLLWTLVFHFIFLSCRYITCFSLHQFL